MRTYLAIGMVIAVALGAGGCMVSKTKYMEAVAESEAAKTDLEKARAMKTALEQQVKTLKDLNGKLTADSELVHAELQRIKESRDKERASIEGRIRELESRNKELAAQYRTIRQEDDELKRTYENLKVTMARYQKELKERPRAIAPPGQPAPTTQPGVRAPGGGGMKPLAPPPAQAAPPGPTESGLAFVNINTASANDMVLFLGLNREVAERVVVNRPYRLKGELVAKNIMPKAVFDSIRDKISVGQ
jgi:DNA uptake protein ComE-like DNA-binding protein